MPRSSSQIGQSLREFVKRSSMPTMPENRLEEDLNRDCLNNISGWNKAMEWRDATVGSVKMSHQFTEKKFKCRFLAEFLVGATRSVECYKMALNCAQSYERKQLPKYSITLSQNEMKISFHPEPVSSTKKRVCTSFNSGMSTSLSSSINSDVDDLSTGYSPTNSSQQQQQQARVMFDEYLAYNSMSYCGILPDHPNIFLIVSRTSRGPICRMFSFSSISKVGSIKRNISVRFERAHREWQMRLSRIYSSSYGVASSLRSY